MATQTKPCAEALIANRDLLQLLQEVIQMTPSTAAASGVTQRILSEGAVLALNLFISGALRSNRFRQHLMHVADIHVDRECATVLRFHRNVIRWSQGSLALQESTLRTRCAWRRARLLPPRRPHS